MKIFKFLLIFFFFTFHAHAKELPRIDTKFYLGIYKSFDKLSSYATSLQYPSLPYSLETDDNKENLGFFLGYDVNFEDFIIGIETNFQENVGADQTVAFSVIGREATYEKMLEAKLKLGYSINDFRIFTYLGRGNLDVQWPEYQSDPDNASNYWTRGLVIDYIFFRDFFIGLNYDQTILDLIYSSTNYIEEVYKRSLRLRIGYVF